MEDTETIPGELVAHFGNDVAAVVAEVTDDKELTKEERKQLQVLHAPKAMGRAKLVKLADKICNLRDIQVDPPEHWSIGRRHEYFAWAKNVVEGLRGIHPELEAVFDRVHAAGPKTG